MVEFKEFRKNLLHEAKASPNLLSDLAGLENYIAESYNNRSFIELLQNADDAGSTKFKIIRNENYLFVANNGRIFNDKDLESLCRSASSTKVRGESIGYRGIGFKSVVGFASEIHIISGDLEFTFSKKRTEIEIPQARKVPLIRIPHNLEDSDKKQFQSFVFQLKNEGYNTIFIFSDITAREIELEFNSFDTSSLLFLRNINETDLNITDQRKTKIEKSKYSEKTSRVKITTKDNEKTWLIKNDNTTSLAFEEKDGEIEKLAELNSLVYSFLPTEDKNGLGLIINSDFSTDPSRKHIILDTKTLSSLKSCSKQIITLFEENIKLDKNSSIGIVNAIIPYTDLRMLQFKKPSFEKFLAEELKSIENNIFNSYSICPSWLNIKDFDLLYQDTKNRINPKCFELDGFISFIKYLGANEATLNSFIGKINEVEISTLGCIQISVQLIKGFILKRNEFDIWLPKLKILKFENKRVSFEDLNDLKRPVDESFVSLLIENGLTEFDIKQVFEKFLPIDSTEKLFKKPSNENMFPQNSNADSKSKQWFDLKTTESILATKSNFRKWRSAEESTLEILNFNGFKLNDVSKQNIGYDLEGVDPSGREIQIEVKSINLIGEKFKLTNNEVAVAQEKKDSYFIAVVRQLDNFIEIALISDPVKNLVLNRQCVQWIWECSSYEYQPTRFKI